MKSDEMHLTKLSYSDPKALPNFLPVAESQRPINGDYLQGMKNYVFFGRVFVIFVVNMLQVS